MCLLFEWYNFHIYFLKSRIYKGCSVGFEPWLQILGILMLNHLQSIEQLIITDISLFCKWIGRYLGLKLTEYPS